MCLKCVLCVIFHFHIRLLYREISIADREKNTYLKTEYWRLAFCKLEKTFKKKIKLKWDRTMQTYREWMVACLDCAFEPTPQTHSCQVWTGPKGEALSLNWLHSRERSVFDVDSTKALTICCYYYIIILLLWQIYSRAVIIGLKNPLGALLVPPERESQGQSSDQDCSCTSRSTN